MDINNYIDSAFDRTTKKIEYNLSEILDDLKDKIDDKLHEHFLLDRAERTGRNTISLFDKKQNENFVTTQYRDKMLIERGNIIQNYYQKTKDKGEMYYIYNISSNDSDTFLMSYPIKERSHEIIKIKEENLPKDAGVDSILRIKNGKYVLDEEATKYIVDEMDSKFNDLLKEQNKNLQNNRIEDNLYEVIEVQDNYLLLGHYDFSSGNLGFYFEENMFPNSELDMARVGDYYLYANGHYEYIK